MTQLHIGRPQVTQQTLLDSISSPADLRRLDVHQLPQLAQELRAFMVESVSKTGGHLSSSLGATELAIAIHTAFNTPEDRVIWDVGHQAYAHKIPDGAPRGMATLRKHFTASRASRSARSSPYDAFGTAHSSTSISAALGMAIAARLETRPTVGTHRRDRRRALTGGMALEALNDAGVWEGRKASGFSSSSTTTTARSRRLRARSRIISRRSSRRAPTRARAKSPSASSSPCPDSGTSPSVWRSRRSTS